MTTARERMHQTKGYPVARDILAPGHALRIERRALTLPLPVLYREANAKRHAATRAVQGWLADSYRAEADIMLHAYRTRTGGVTP
jgi:hypothetical protein